MKILKMFLTPIVGLLLAVAALDAPAQAILPNTTLSGAVTSDSTNAIVLASATGVLAPNPANPNSYTYLFVDREAMSVNAVSGTTITVERGASGTTAKPHASGAVVFVIQANLTVAFGWLPQGSCTRANELALPRIYFSTGVISDCLGGQWVNGDSTQTTRTLYNQFRYPDPGATIYTSLQTSGTAIAAATQIECSQLDLPASELLTGLGVLNGTTVGTDKHWVLLYDATGNVVATSATAGATTSGASTYQTFAFTAKYYAVAPARFFACYGSNGTTDTVRHTLTGVNDNILGGAVTGQVFGTAAAITVPSTFTSAKAPYFIAY